MVDRRSHKRISHKKNNPTVHNILGLSKKEREAKKRSQPKKEPNFTLGFSKKKKKSTSVPTKGREINFLPTNQDLVIATHAMLTPSPGEKEQLVIIKENRDGTFEYHYTKLYGNGNEVNGPIDKYDDPKLRKNSLIDIHTHPRWLPPSSTDVLVLLQHDRVKEVHVSTPRGIIYILQRTKQVDPKSVNENNVVQDYQQFVNEGNEQVKSLSPDNYPLGSLNDQEMAGKLIGIQKLGDKYGFKITAARRDEVIKDL